ncbi:MAG TPA: hypothetical protein VF013_00720 [Candidatus Limnocylindria bacterium]
MEIREATVASPAGRATTRRSSRLVMLVLGGSLVIGLAVAALSYLGTSLAIWPEVRADAAVLRERGARLYFDSCAQFFEPRFWPECIGDADDKRARGARELVAFCTGVVRYNRFFGPEDCLSDDRPLAALTVGPRPEDATAGVAAALAALGALSVAGIAGRRIPRRTPDLRASS